MWTQTLHHIATNHTRPAQPSGTSLTSEIQLAAALAAILGATVGLYRLTTAILRRTVLSRRYLTTRLNQLACGVTTQYIDQLFGPPAFRRALDNNHAEHVHRTRHAWLQTIVNTTDQSVAAFAITVTDPRFAFRTRDLTADLIDIRLGRTSFSEIQHIPDGIRVTRGANRFQHAESHWFGNPGLYQIYVLAHNDAGCGKYQPPPDAKPRGTGWTSGRLNINPPHLPSWDPVPGWLTQPRKHTAINTLLVCRDSAEDQPIALTHGWLGIDQGHVRTLRTPQQRRRFRRHLRKLQKPPKTAPPPAPTTPPTHPTEQAPAGDPQKT